MIGGGIEAETDFSLFFFENTEFMHDSACSIKPFF